jgi:hypothetical protein
MTDLDQLRRLDMEIRVAECEAVERLAEHLYEAVRDLPSESRLALVFVQIADKLQGVARERTPSLGAHHHLQDIEREFRELQDPDNDGEGE